MSQMIKKARRRQMAEINVVPYIDVMLVLLVIFMITAPLITAGIHVELPQAESEVLPPDAETPLIASIDETGTYFLSIGSDTSDALTLEELIEKVLQAREDKPNAPVMIEGAKKVEYEKVVQLLVSLSEQVGIENVGLMTEPMPES